MSGLAFREGHPFTAMGGGQLQVQLQLKISEPV